MTLSDRQRGELDVLRGQFQEGHLKYPGLRHVLLTVPRDEKLPNPTTEVPSEIQMKEENWIHSAPNDSEGWRTIHWLLRPSNASWHWPDCQRFLEGLARRAGRILGDLRPETTRNKDADSRWLIWVHEQENLMRFAWVNSKDVPPSYRGRAADDQRGYSALDDLLIASAMGCAALLGPEPEKDGPLTGGRFRLQGRIFTKITAAQMVALECLWGEGAMAPVPLIQIAKLLDNSQATAAKHLSDLKIKLEGDSNGEWSVVNTGKKCRELRRI